MLRYTLRVAIDCDNCGVLTDETINTIGEINRVMGEGRATDRTLPRGWQRHGRAGHLCPECVSALSDAINQALAGRSDKGN